MSYQGHNQHGQFAGSAARTFAPHPQQTNSSQLGLAQHTQQQSQQPQHQQYATHLQHHTPNNSNFGLSPLAAASSYKLDSTRDSRQTNGLQSYGSMSGGSWNSTADMTGFGQTPLLAQPHHSAPQPSLPMSQYSQPQPQPQPQQQPQPPPQPQQHPQHTFQLFSAHSQSPTHLR
ncbi:hypothetical protein BGZ65_012146, partial [Modicella reniformis]